MKRTLFIICCFFAIGLVSISFTSCNSCGDTERFIDDIGYGSWDFDGDGNAGREINFKGANKGRCQTGGTYYKRTSKSNTDCYWCDEPWHNHIGATGSAPDNWD